MLSTLTRASRYTLAAIVAATSISVHAQTSSSGTLEEIVVTAQKREQNSQDIGISLSAVTGNDLNSVGAAAAADITKSMPAVVLLGPRQVGKTTLAQEIAAARVTTSTAPPRAD